MITPRTIQNVKDAVRIEEVLGDFIALKRKGPRYLGLCPFHNEKTPSFNVSPNLGIYKCFGCGESGDAISFLTKHEHLSYPEAIRWLAKRYQVDIEEEESTPEQALEQSERESISVIQQWALNWSVDQLWNTDEGKRIAHGYFRERGFTDATIKEFQLGYVPERGDAFAQAALANGFNPELLEKAGWIKLREDGTPWDFFQGRVTFPVQGVTGLPIAFGARTLRSDKKLPKYFNSPESVLYNKSRSLYGIFHAKKAIVERNTCCLVEGYTDVISLHQAGIHNVVASSGTSLTEDQVRLIKRYAPSVTILYDGDNAGIKASLRGIDLILKEGLNVKVVLFPNGEDPDSFARTRPSSELAAFVKDNAKDFLVFKAGLLMADAGDDPVSKASAIHEIVESIALVPDHVLRSLYLQQCSRLLLVNEQALISELNKVLRRAYRKKLGGDQALPEEMLEPKSGEPLALTDTEISIFEQEREIMKLLLRYGPNRLLVKLENADGSIDEEEMSVAEMIFNLLSVDEIYFNHELFQTIYHDYRHSSNLGETIGLDRFISHDDPEIRGTAIGLVTDKDELSPGWLTKRINVHHESDNLQKTVNSVVNSMKLKYSERLRYDIQIQIREEKDEANWTILLMKQMKVEDSIKELSNALGRTIIGYPTIAPSSN